MQALILITLAPTLDHADRVAVLRMVDTGGRLRWAKAQLDAATQAAIQLASGGSGAGPAGCSIM